MFVGFPKLVGGLLALVVFADAYHTHYHSWVWDCKVDHVFPNNDYTTASIEGCKKIYLRDNGIGNTGAIALALALKFNTGVTHLDLLGTGIQTNGAIAIAEALKTNCALTWLHMQDNDIAGRGAKAIAEALKINIALSFINLDYTGSCGACGLRSGDVTAFAETLQVNTALTELDMRGHRGSASASASIETSLARNLLNHPNTEMRFNCTTPTTPTSAPAPLCNGNGTQHVQPDGSCICSAQWVGRECDLENVTDSQVMALESILKQARVAARAAGCIPDPMQYFAEGDIMGGGAGESAGESLDHDLESDLDAGTTAKQLDSILCETLNNAVAVAEASFAEAMMKRSNFEAAFAEMQSYADQTEDEGGGISSTLRGVPSRVFVVLLISSLFSS